MAFAGTWKCAGFGGNDIVVSVDDERSFVGFGPKPTETCAYRKTFCALQYRPFPGRMAAQERQALCRHRALAGGDG